MGVSESLFKTLLISLRHRSCNIILAALDGVIQHGRGPFYPLNVDNSRWLSYYSRVFDYVEIDSSFYRIPNAFMVKNWSKKTPTHFRSTASPKSYYP